MNTDAADVLDEAAKLVERGWTQGAYARNRDGTPCSAHDDAAICWCAEGAVQAVCTDGTLQLDALDALLAAADRWEAVPPWNDHPNRTASEVADTMRRAAARLRGET